MVKNAWNFIVPALLIGAAFGVLGMDGYPCAWAVTGLTIVFAGFCAYFFRSPQRSIPSDPDILVSPADGRVIAVEPVEDAWLGKGVEIRIFLNVFNVHVQRSPFTTPPRWRAPLFRRQVPQCRVPKASVENEQHWFRLASAKRRVVVKQIAGLIARRILPWAAPATPWPPAS